jgi:thiamine biosynthesis lipoprotein
MATEIPGPETEMEEKAGVLEVALNFRAMNTHVEALVYTGEVEKAASVCDHIQGLFEYNEAVLSRFKPDSELSELNRTGYMERASELLFRNVAAACDMHEFTGGVFDATLLEALEAAGYNRSFELISSPGPHLLTVPPPVVAGPWRPRNQARITLDYTRKSIQLAPGVRVDLGGIAKGTTVDQVAEFLRLAGFDCLMVGAGGDMFLEGCPPQDRRGWHIVVDNPLAKEAAPVASLVVTNRAIATSSQMGRSWYLGRERQHHLIDPRTNRPAVSPYASVTVEAPSVQVADVMAKVALILGPEKFKEAGFPQKANLGRVVFVTLEGEVIHL